MCLVGGTDHSEVAALTNQIRVFADARDWTQFHSPRNLLLALVGEVGELAAEFQWIDDAELVEALDTASTRTAITEELADVFIYLLRLSDVLGMDLVAAAHDKLLANEERYPVDLSRGSAAKYTAYE